MAEEKENPNLKPCKSCGKEISIKAKQCPHCGVDHPALTWKNHLATLLVLIAVFSLLSYCAAEPDKDTTAKAEQSEPVKQATVEELKTSYETSTVRASIIKTLRIMIEPMVTPPNQTQITQDLLDAKRVCKGLAHASFTEETPRTDKELADLYREMNHSLSFAARAICNRIDSAIDLSSGTNKPAKAAEEFESARQWFEHEWSEYETAAQTIGEKLEE